MPSGRRSRPTCRRNGASAGTCRPGGWRAWGPHTFRRGLRASGRTKPWRASGSWASPTAQGQNPARQAAIAAGVPKEVPAWGLNQVCGSGLRAVAVGAQSILSGDAQVVVAGGQESMSLSAHAAHMRLGTRSTPLRV
ncbi:MAG TPA: hypothetical protein VJS38_16610, partial [Phenylobacterium sp.]|nr:hypothetical protein [Phenylobacterium sp.]